MGPLRLVVRNKILETSNAATLVLRSEDEKAIPYDAGQFLTLLFDLHGTEIRRSYSFSSSPGIDPEMAITVRRIENGLISRFLFDHVLVGDSLNAIAPAGRFRLEPARQYFFIAAGIGITPIISLIKKALAEEPKAKLVLITQNHSESAIVFYHALRSLVVKNNERLEWISLLSHPVAHAHSVGRLNNTLLAKLVEKKLEDREPLFYICGPEALMRMAVFTLASMGFPGDSIKRENFKVDYKPPLPLLDDYSPKLVNLRLQEITHSFSVSFPKTILQAALDQGINLPYSCRAGRCSTCVARCMRGEVIMSNNEVLTDKDISDGLVLTCVGYAKSDLELEVT